MKWLINAIILCIILLSIWEGMVLLWQLPNYILPTPWQVLKTLYQQYDVIATQSIPTLIEILLGFVLGILFGCIAGFLAATCRPIALWFLPLLIISQAIPTFAVAPLFVIWLGYGLAAKVLTAILMIFFPVASTFYDGLKQVNHEWLNLAKTMNATSSRLFWQIRLPAALPAFASGVRIAAVTAPIGAIVGEWVGSSQGLGYLMLNANARMQIDVMFAALIVIIGLTLALYFSVDKLLKKLIWW